MPPANLSRSGVLSPGPTSLHQRLGARAQLEGEDVQSGDQDEGDLGPPGRIVDVLIRCADEKHQSGHQIDRRVPAPPTAAGPSPPRATRGGRSRASVDRTGPRRQSAARARRSAASRRAATATHVLGHRRADAGVLDPRPPDPVMRHARAIDASPALRRVDVRHQASGGNCRDPHHERRCREHLRRRADARPIRCRRQTPASGSRGSP